MKRHNEGRDLAHEHDMEMLRKQQLRDDISPEEADDEWEERNAKWGDEPDELPFDLFSTEAGGWL